MAVGNDTAQSTSRAEIDQLEHLVRELQDECARLRKERDLYKQAFVDQARAAREFADLDFETLQAMSAGPVEMIE